ncbi:hypothetical protein CRG98_004300 [Punica granatum]|uniref:FAS1 domain-containing protein n=1 Tax=Punica granatum TaxID=22663 RepID=A0A2I0L3Q7_PUNGR|nr:hypothetical protein CRG98_004300 [Punica granatum]
MAEYKTIPRFYLLTQMFGAIVADILHFVSTRGKSSIGCSIPAGHWTPGGIVGEGLKDFSNPPWGPCPAGSPHFRPFFLSLKFYRIIESIMVLLEISWRETKKKHAGSNKGKAATMDSKALCFILVAAFLVWTPTASAFNITRLLGRYPNFSTFNDYLTQTKLYEQINRRQTITVLVVDNSAIGGISGKPLDLIKRILSTHVVLDYYDTEKLHDLSKKSTLLTTLYQASGIADNQQGFLNVTKKGSSGDVVFGSAVKGSSLDANLVQQVAAQPYNVSVLQVSSIINTPGLDGADVNSTSAPSPPPPAKTPAKAPSPSTAEAPAEEATAPESSDAPSDAPADAPAADGPSPSSSVPADAKAPASSKSPSTRVASSTTVLAVISFFALSLW